MITQRFISLFLTLLVLILARDLNADHIPADEFDTLKPFLR